MTCCTHDCNQGRDCPARHARAVQDFDSLPQYIAARQAERDAAIERNARWLRTWGRGLMWSILGAGVILFASAAAPKVAHHIAHPATIQH